MFESAFVSAQRSTLLLLCLFALTMLAVSSLIPRVTSGSQVESASRDGRANPSNEATETVEEE